MGLTVNEIKDFASKATNAMSQIKWFHGVTITYHTSPLSIIQNDICIVLSKDIMAKCRVTSATRPSEARRRIEEHMSIGFDGTKMSIRICDRVKVVELRYALEAGRQADVANFLKYKLKYGVEAWRGDQAEVLSRDGYFG
jgi:hypothetical protein